MGEILLIADGMGGIRGGGVAADLAAKRFPVHVRNLECTLDGRETLQEAAARVNRELYEQAADAVLQARMGATIVVAALRPRHPELGIDRRQRRGWQVLSVGARSLAWLLTKDHTVTAQLVEHGLLQPDEARTHQDNHLLTRALGLESELSLEFAGPIALAGGDGILLCSDGLSGTVADEEVARVLAQAADAGSAVRQLADCALHQGSADNISIQYAILTEARDGVEAGTQIGRYVLEKRLGEGGMGEVWLARHQELGALYAIKFMLPGFSNDAVMRARFLQEGQLQAELKHIGRGARARL